MVNKAIICVDDERIILNGLQSQLSRGFGDVVQIEVAESAEEALELIEELKKEGILIPVIITDQLMPGMKGSEFLEIVAEILPSTSNILLTGQADAEAVGKALNSGNLYRYISKPWESTDLILTIKEAITRFEQGAKLEIQNEMLQKYNDELEQTVSKRTKELENEKHKSDTLLQNVLPLHVAEELKEKGKVLPKHFDTVSVMFTDFQGFTKFAQNASATDVVEALNECFSAFDEIIEKHNIEKIKTIGDAYMCAGGMPIENTTNPLDIVRASWEIKTWVEQWNKNRALEGKDIWPIRIGVHSGEVVAGVIGKKKFQYDLWGDAVNVASRMESTGEAGKINISSETFELVKNEFECEYRGEIETKNRGEIGMYFVKSPR